MTQAANLLYQRYRYIALAVYVAVLMAGFIDWSYGGIGPRTIIAAPECHRFVTFVVVVLALIGMEVRGFGQDSFLPGHRAEIFPFLLRLGFFVGACLVADLSYSQILFLPILLYTHLAVSEALSYGLAVLGVCLLIGIKQIGPQGLERPPLPSMVVDGASELPSRAPRNPSRSGRLVDQSMGVLITLFFTLLLARAMTQAIQAQQRLTHLVASLKASHTQLRQYSAQIAELATAEERSRLARDIHDGLGHHLAAISIQLQKASAYKSRDPDRSYAAITQAQSAVQDALADIRLSVSSLHQG
ncbi:MAG: histidine kinase dimerization/phosphoacceptor domain-containing protein, partial [Cyanobacteria bacterium J06632_22]